MGVQSNRTEREDNSMTLAVDPTDRGAIVDLLYAYAWHFDQNEPEKLAALFTSDSVIDYGPEFENIIGRDAIVAAIQPGLSNLFSSSAHHITNPRVWADGGDEATGTFYIYAWHTYHDRGGDGEMWGQYHCRFRRTEEGWRISELTLKVMGMKNFHRDKMHTIGRRP